jgi:uncharacterized protein (DUF1778 family)
VATKTARLDLRLTETQRRAVTEAAELTGSTVSGWAVSRLTESAFNELAAARTTLLPSDAFEAFLEMLDAPEDPRMAELLARTPIWLRNIKE